MGKIKLRMTAKAPVDACYRAGMSVSDSPEMLPNIRELRVVDKSDDGSRVKSRWTAAAKLLTVERSLSWMQEDTWDEENRTCRFCLCPGEKGNMKKYDGTWAFRPHPDGTEMLMEVDCKVQHPLATKQVHRLIDGIMKKNQKALLETIRDKAESEARER